MESNCDESCQTEVVAISRDFDNVGLQDLAAFDRVTSQGVLSNIQKRFINDICYTSIGGMGTSSYMLLYVNPNKPLAIYNEDFKRAYHSLLDFDSTPPPHIYSMVNGILLRGRSGLQRRQSIIITGESGSGKSNNFRQILDYINWTCNNRISNIVNNYNRFIELFSNSFFSTKCMKLLEMDFDFLGNIVGAQFFNYHLDKWCVHGGSNFHIFNVLLGGCESSLLKSLGLVRNVGSYKILTNNNNHRKINMDEQFTFFKGTLNEVLVDSAINSMDVLKVLGALLKLGNVSFVPTTNLDGTEGIEVNYSNYNSFQFGPTVDELLGLVNVLNLGKDSVTSNVILKTLIEEIYMRLFNWLVRRLRTESSKSTCFKLNILDYEGYNLKAGNYSSFLVNYINEKVQLVLIDNRLRLSQELYIKEGIEWILIDTNPLGSLVTFIESDFVSKLNENSFEIVGLEVKGDEFKIKHFNNVNLVKSYSKLDFLDKNFKLLPVELLIKLNGSGNLLIKELFCLSEGLKLSNASQVIINVGNCVVKLANTNLHYIKCIKPNDIGEGSKFEVNYVKFQIQFHRVIDSCKFIKDGYSYHFTMTEFVHRFKLLSLKTWPNQCGSVRRQVFSIMEDVGFLEGNDFLLSRHKDNIVFLKNNVLRSLEMYRYERQDDLTILLQKTWRAWKVRRSFKLLKSAQILIGRNWKAYLQRKKVHEVYRLKKYRKAVGVIQRIYIQWKRQMYLRELLRNIRNAGLNMTSPVCKEWPYVPSYLQETNCLLKSIFHRWRCRVYRIRIERGTERARLNEKATASLIFKNHKLSYTRSISHPFLGDYIRLRQNSQWRRTAMYLTPAPSQLQCNNLQENEYHQQYQPFNIVFADLINKVTRSSGKFLPIVLVVTTTEILILDPRTLNLKYKINFGDLLGISMSTLNDDICLMHIKESNNSTNNSTCGLVMCSAPSATYPASSAHNTFNSDNTSCIAFENYNLTKGDLILHTCHLIEMVTKIYLVYKNFFQADQAKLPILFGNEFPATFGVQSMTVCFKEEGSSRSGVIPPSQMRISRKKYCRMEFILL